MNKVKKRIDHLMKIWKLYDDLNVKTGGKYRWRQKAISDQLDILWDVIEDREDGWEYIYEEDLRTEV